VEVIILKNKTIIVKYELSRNGFSDVFSCFSYSTIWKR